MPPLAAPPAPPLPAARPASAGPRHLYARPAHAAPDPGRAAEFVTLAELLDETDELVCVTGPDGRIAYVNGAWCRALGYTAREAVGLRPVDLVVPEHQGAYRAAARRLMAGHAIDAFEAVLVSRDGRRVVCRGRATPHMARADADGAPRRCLGARAFYRDVTAERQGECLRARLVATLEASPDFVAVETRGGALAYLNRAGRHLVGLAEDAPFDGLHGADVRPPAEQARFVDTILPAALRDGRWVGESALLGPAGEPVPVELTAVAHPSTRDGDPSPYFVSVIARDLRPRQAAAAALRTSEAHYRAVVDALAEGVIVQDAAGAVTAWNASAERILGLAAGELAGRDARDPAWRPLREDGTPFPADELPVVRTLRTGEPVDGVVMAVHQPGGTRRLLRVSTRALYDAAPGAPDALDALDGPHARPPAPPSAAVATFSDITTERDAAEALARLSEVASRIDDAVVIADAEGRATWVNAAFTRMTGYAPHEVVGRTPGSVLQGPGTDAAAAERLRDAVRAGRGAQAELLNYRKDGTPYWLDLTISPVRDADGRLRGFVAVQRDASERRRAEHARLELATAVAMAPDGIGLTAADGTFKYVNAAHAAIYGYAADEIEGRDWQLLYDADEVARLESLVFPALAAEGRWCGEAVGRRRDGTRFPQELQLARMPWGGLVCSVRDISERKAAARALEELLARDELTGLLNRRGFFARATAALARAARDGVPCVLLYGDVNRFKQLNDSYGHAVGDDGLRAVAAALRVVTGPADLAARLGGDEFVVLLVGAGAAAADAARERLHRALAGTPIAARDGAPPVYVTAAFGAAAQPAEGDAEAEGEDGARAAARLARLLREADASLYAAKRGRA